MYRHVVMSRSKIISSLFSSSSSFFRSSKFRQFASQTSPVFVDGSTKVLCLGISDSSSFHIQKAIAYGTKMVGFVERSRGGETHLGLPVYDTIKEAQSKSNAILGPTASIIIGPPEIAANAILEAVKARLELIVCISEVFQKDMDKVKDALKQSETRLIGPNCPGIIKPRQCIMGIMHKPYNRTGFIGIVAGCGTVRNEFSFLAFEQAISQTTDGPLGQSAIIGVGRGPFVGTSIVDCVKKLLADPQTKGIIIIGGEGGSAEYEAAQVIKESGIKKPVVAFIAPIGLSMKHPLPGCANHNRAIMSEGRACVAKMKTLKASGVITVCESSAKMASTVRKLLEQTGPAAAPVSKKKKKKKKNKKQKRKIVWEKPPIGEYKGCSDASIKFSKALSRTYVGVGGFIRNSDGELESGIHDEIVTPPDETHITSAQAEGESILCTVQHAISEGLLPLTMENDNLDVVLKVMDPEPPEDLLPVYEKLRALVREYDVKVVYQPNEVTKIAHKFAGLQLGKKAVFKGIEGVHPDIRDEVRKKIDFDKAGEAHYSRKTDQSKLQ